MNLRFEPITLDRQEYYLALFAQCPQLASDYSFLNLWGWAEEYGLSWAWDEALVWIRQSRPEECLWAPVGSWDAVDWQSLLETNSPMNSTFTRVPEMLANLWRHHFAQEIQVEEERGNWDYLYRVAELIELKGKRYHKKKNLVNQFNRKYDYTYLPFGAKMVEQAMAMQTDWCTWRDCESSDILSSENRAIFKILKEWKQLAGLFGGAVMVEDSMVAYTVAEPLTHDMLLIHFEKGDTQYKGIYQAVNQLFLANSAAQYTFVNREQDLNDEGLRKAKLSYHPEDYIRKYHVSLTGSFM